MDEGDTVRKMVELAEYAARHGEKLGRILVVAKTDDDVFRSVDLNDEAARGAPKAVTTTQSVVRLFADYGVPIAQAAQTVKLSKEHVIRLSEKVTTPHGFWSVRPKLIQELRSDRRHNIWPDGCWSGTHLEGVITTLSWSRSSSASDHSLPKLAIRARIPVDQGSSSGNTASSRPVP
jgi:hypothetical protein